MPGRRMPPRMRGGIALLALDASLRERGSRLNILPGPSLESLQRAAAESGAEAVFWIRRNEPVIELRDAGIKRALRETVCAPKASTAA